MDSYAEHIDRESECVRLELLWRSSLRRIRAGETPEQARWQERYREIAGMYVEHGGEGGE